MGTLSELRPPRNRLLPASSAVFQDRQGNADVRPLAGFAFDRQLAPEEADPFPDAFEPEAVLSDGRYIEADSPIAVLSFHFSAESVAFQA